MSRLLVISADCHAGLPPERYRDYVDPQYREVFDAALEGFDATAPADALPGIDAMPEPEFMGAEAASVSVGSRPPTVQASAATARKSVPAEW